MSIMQIIDAIDLYGLDITLLGAATAVAVAILKRTVFKNANKKLFAFLPFISGALVYAAYYAAVNSGFENISGDYGCIVVRGFTVGAVSTLIFALYEQFVQNKNGLSAAETVVKSLIEGYVPQGESERIAKEICLTVKEIEDGVPPKIAAILVENGAESDGAEILSELIYETLKRILSVGE